MTCCGLPWFWLRPHRVIIIPADIVKMASVLPHTMVTPVPASTDEQKRSRAEAQKMADKCGVSIAHDEGQGSQGRIFSLNTCDQVMKVSVTRSVNRELHNYSRLRAANIPCASASLSVTEESSPNTFVTAMVMERLSFTLTAVIRACGMVTSGCHACFIPRLVQTCLLLLQQLQRHRITYIDLSPDNIMFRQVGKHTYEMVLIDPSYMIMDSPCTNENFDRLYLGYKVFALGLIHPHCWTVCKSIGSRLLLFEPSRYEVIHWLQTMAPRAVQCVSDVYM